MSDLSPEIRRLVKEYKTDTKQMLKENCSLEYLYALSEIRENILEWFEFKPQASLLQVGSDYGALTGLYSRRVQEVVVLDEDQDNLEVNRLRYSHLNNIQYINGSLSSYEEMKFDYVVMIGSLEKPYDQQIAAAKARLKPEGKLIVAVCNRYGIKYWAGTPLDYYNFSRDEITSIMTQSDQKVHQMEWYYPMPDYKLPTMIYSPEYLPKKGDLTHAVIAYDYPRYLGIDVGAAYDTVCDDQQFENYANSFLLIWSNYEGN